MSHVSPCPSYRWLALALLALLAPSIGACRGASRPTAGRADPQAQPAAPGAPQPSGQPGVGPRAPAAGPGQRLQPSDFSYRGAFRLPEDFGWGARGMALQPAAAGRPAVLLVIGRDQRPVELGRVALVAPVPVSDFRQAPLAPLLGPIASFDGSLAESVSTEYVFGSGIAYVPRRGTQRSDKLYGSIDNWYGVEDETFPTVWFSELDGSRPRGLFHVGPKRAPFHGNMAGDYLFAVPQWYADANLGGRSLVTGKTRGAFHGSQGPTLFAFRPWDSEQPSGDLDALPLLFYRIRYPECAGPNVGDPRRCDFPGFTMCDKWQAGAFVESGPRRAIVLSGVKGLGPNGYGEAPSAKSCEPSKGYHCDPFERQVLFYDVDELGAVARGRREPWSVVPYAVWRPGELFLQGHTCGQMGGMTFDPATGTLLVAEKGLGENNDAAVHVWAVAPAPGR
ncbi:MAG: hypothetical protein HY744_04340 [Deltaproteobacteria bacterium]|nr:hypothetical protein [Deltaproteobacteria bacterium]